MAPEISFYEAEPLNDVEERSLYEMIVEMHRVVMKLPTIPDGPKGKKTKSKSNLLEFRNTA